MTIRTTARIAGFFYLLVFVTGIPALFVLGRLLVRDPAATAANILAHESLSLVFFGFYCLLIGYLILNSTFLPRFVGVGMVIAGLGWLTFLWPPLSRSLSPYNLLPGIAGEGLLTLWLLVMGVNAERWKEQAQ